MSPNYDKLVGSLGRRKLQYDEPLSKHTTFKIGGAADVLVNVSGALDLIRAVTLCRELQMPFFVLGGGSNVIVGDRGFPGVVIANCAGTAERVDDELVEVTSGISNTALVRYLVQQELGGLEFLAGIPGTIGGAIRNNGHFRHPRSFDQHVSDFHSVADQFVCDFLEEVLLLTANGNIRKVGVEYVQPLYHRTWLKESGDIIVSALFRLRKTEKELIQRSIREHLLWRKNRKFTVPDEGKSIEMPPDPITGRLVRQPHLPSPGCIFSNVPNPDNHPVSRMLDLCGLRGVRVGDVMIAIEHANYMVNLGAGKAADAIALVEICQKRVRERFGVELTLEVDLVGEF